MLDSRVHFIYLCVVFLMLGFGILIGSSLYLPAEIIHQQRSLQSLQAQVDGAVQDGRIAKARLSEVEDGLETMRPGLVRGVLTGRRIDIVQCSDYPQASVAALNALQDAGATVAATVTINDQLFSMSPNQKEDLRSQLTHADPTLTGATDDTADMVVNVIGRALLHGVATGSPSVEIIRILEREGLISVNGDVSTATTSFVLVGGRNDDGLPDESDVSGVEGRLADQLSAPTPGVQVTIVGCEPLDATYSSIPEFQKSEIATVDCIDHPSGKIALPFAIRGDHDDFGLKATAHRVVPQDITVGRTP